MALLSGNHSTNNLNMDLMGCVTVKYPAKRSDGPRYDPHDCYLSEESCSLMLFTFLILSPLAITAVSQYLESFKFDQIMIRRYKCNIVFPSE